MFDTETNSVAPDTDDLDAFDTMFHGHETPIEDTKEPASSEEEVVEDDADANELEDDTLANEDEANEDGSEDGEDDDEVDPEPDPKPKKNRFQDRIDELTAKAREAERREKALEARLNDILEKVTPKAEAAPEKVEAFNGPSPDALNEDGTDKYPLGEFDPLYIRDLTRYTIAEETKAYKEAETERTKIQEEETAKVQLAQEWTGKLQDATEKYPDLQEKNYQLVASFEDLEPAYGEYLANTIMTMDNGTDVLYYLANNLEEAGKIAASGPTRATLALGRIGARYELQREEQKERKLKVSNAPTPPPRVNKGAASVASVAPDTDDLEAFETLLFPKRGR